MVDKDLIKKYAKIELARREFFYFCNLMAPDFYKHEREYLKELCDELQDFYYSNDDVLIINMPPRFGKSRTVGLFTQWVLGKNQKEKIMTGSYNETLSTVFSKNVRDSISEVKADDDKIVYSDIFPGVRIKKGDAAMNLWSLEGGYNNYLATSPTGTATGFGCTLMIIDDLIKNAEEAYNENVLEKHWSWFCFVGDTKIATSTGNKRIKDIRVGDKILTFNHSQCIIEEQRVVKTNNHLDFIYRLEFNNGTKVECTGNHKFYTNKGYLSVEQILSVMRCSIKEGETILFTPMQEQSEGRTWGKDDLQKLWQGDSFGQEKQTDHVLFFGMQTPIQGESCTRSICGMGKIAGCTESETQEVRKMRMQGKSACSPYRPQHKEQFDRQSDCTLPIVPYTLSQVTRLPSSDLRRVYDIEVEGNHNFFANGMLVHNCNTMLSRLEEGGKIIIIMTRWATGDLAGRALEHFREEGKKIRHISMKALQNDGTMLCPEILSRESYEMKVRAMGEDIASANYQQEPLDLKGRLYNSFKTYTDIPRDQHGNLLFTRISAYVDTADQGDDYLCAIVYGEYNMEAYVLDVLYTKEPMEVTEPATAKMLYENEVNVATIESNNGGRGFARAVERILREKYRINRTKIKWFHQSKNKKARILSNATWVMEHVYFPVNWRDRWPEYYKAMTTYQREGKNQHDDAPDATTGIAENIGKVGISVLK